MVVLPRRQCRAGAASLDEGPINSETVWKQRVIVMELLMKASIGGRTGWQAGRQAGKKVGEYKGW